ncbi:hypothetical protein EYF80_036283 [Liparis tanakae]|uniref:Uncharacterized protein n=1 Tax=Liparis tanakae TaxID=230148 RepID=A0A4Z2GJU7_9TELE|nr:hypothetical protein EYF80_036283 [Liparis tanakae]
MNERQRRKQRSKNQREDTAFFTPDQSELFLRTILTAAHALLNTPSAGSSSKGTAGDQLPSQQTLSQEKETACLLFPDRCYGEWVMVRRRTREGNCCGGEPSRAEEGDAAG